LYLFLPAQRYNTDGLRVFPALREVRLNSVFTRSVYVRDLSLAYREPYYYRANVRMHLLFPAYAQAAGAVFRFLTGRDELVRAVQVANALMSAATVLLSMLLVSGLAGSPALGLLTGLGLAVSSAFSLTATNIAEVAPSLPWLLLGLLVLARRRTVRGATAAGALLAVSTGCYLATLVITAALGVLLLLERDWRRATALLLASALGTLLIYVAVLLTAGHSSLPALAHALLGRQDQGNYGHFRVSHLLSILVALPNSLAPVLPDNFGGLREFARLLRAPGPAGALSLAGLCLVWLLLLLLGRRVLSRRGILQPVQNIGLAVFSGALLVSLVWDPYHPKFWAYSNIGFWLMVAGVAADVRKPAPTGRSAGSIRGWAAATALAGLLALGTARLVREHRPDPKLAAAERIVESVRTGAPGIPVREPHSEFLVVGGWDPEFVYLSLLLPDTNLLCLPDLALELKRDYANFAGHLQQRLADVLNRHGRAFFVNLVGRKPEQLVPLYVRRLGFTRFLPELAEFSRRSRLVWSDSLSGATLSELSTDYPGLRP
jgi:hypothetical protein